MTELDPLKYPIGKFAPSATYSQQQMLALIDEIRSLPGKIRNAVTALTETQLDTPYRPGGWTIRQVVHHIADSHINAFIRLKWALTENTPTIKPYEEAYWALLPDYKLPVQPSIQLLEGLHFRFVTILENLNDEQWDRAYIHPANGQTVSLRTLLGMYAWHGNHHLAHITGVKF